MSELGLSRLVHAHPHRVRDYIDPEFKPRYDLCDGIEVYNAGDADEINELGLQDAKRLGKLMTSGGDVHKGSVDPKLGRAGMWFPRRLKSVHDYIDALKNSEGQIVFHGKIRNLY